MTSSSEKPVADNPVNTAKCKMNVGCIESAAAVARNMMDIYFKEHHEFFSKIQCEKSGIPESWITSPANTSFNTK